VDTPHSLCVFLVGALQLLLLLSDSGSAPFQRFCLFFSFYALEKISCLADFFILKCCFSIAAFYYKLLCFSLLDLNVWLNEAAFSAIGLVVGSCK
jgi:hypothetical protein